MGLHSIFYMFKTSHALIICTDEGQTLGYNFLKQKSFVCSEDILLLLHFLNAWRSFAELANEFPEFSNEELCEALEALAEQGAILEHGSEAAENEHKKIGQWEWGIPSAMLHYCEQDREFVSREEAEEIQRERASHLDKPSQYKLNTSFNHVEKLPTVSNCGSILDTMKQRRTVREVKQQTISKQVVSDCLFAGMGITGSAENCVGELPLALTPSGGARNPYEAYIYANQVEGLEPGFYHYSAYEHSLGLVRAGRINNPAELVGSQPWVNTMACVVFLCADFTRTMWKYQDNNAYRVVLIEAGHIGQNIMLAATEHECTACPSAALSHTRISELLELEHDLQSPVYALMLAKR